MKKILLSIAILLGGLSSIAQVCNPQFTWTAGPGNYQITYTNTTQFTPAGTQAVLYELTGINWYWNTPTHIESYYNAGTYTVQLKMKVIDTLTQAVLCIDSVQQTVTVSNPPCYTTISKVNNGGGSYTFTANTPAGSTGLTYTWNFGDNTPTVTGASVTHTYAFSNYYYVTLSVSGGSTGMCAANDEVVYLGGPWNCDSLHANINIVTNGLDLYYNNNSTWLNPQLNVSHRSVWDFGDGTTSTQNNGIKTYALYGTYNITLINEWVDSSTMTVYCTDTTTQQVTLTPISNYIHGAVIGGGSSYTYKVWLISFDSVTNIISAVDSQIVQGPQNNNYAPYSFQNPASGVYRVKAAVINYHPDSQAYAPTYGYSAVNWGNADLINHFMTVNYQAIYMQGVSSPVPGPGFISGNVTQGAGKGTGAGVPNLLIFLRDASNQMQRFTYTDGNGDYSFGNLPAGTYNIYPENMPQVTTPSSGITLASGSYIVSGIDFEKTSTEIYPKATGITSLPSAEIFELYPNPSDGIINLQWSKNVSATAHLQVTDITGREVYTADVDTRSSTTIDLADVGTGVYFIKATRGSWQESQKLIIAK